MERAGGNNHGVCCDVMLAAFSLYVGDIEKAREVISEVPQRRIDTQIAPDGSQPQELRRTLSFHYSIYNLNFFADLCMLAHRVGVNLEDYVSADGRSLYQALNFLSPYMGKSVEEWPYKQIHGWGEKQQDLAMEGGAGQGRLHEPGNLVSQRGPGVQAEHVDVLGEAEPSVEHVEVVGQAAEHQVRVQDGAPAPIQAHCRCHLLGLA